MFASSNLFIATFLIQTLWIKNLTLRQGRRLLQYGLWSLQTGYTKLERFLQKPEVVKLIISFFHYFWCQNWDQWHKMSGKNTHIYFFYFWFKKKQVWAEKIGKKRKNSKNLKVAGNHPDIYFTQYFKNFRWKIKIINFYYSNYWEPEVVGSSCYRKNMGAEFTHLYIPSLC